jgi:hypothetical protein
MLPKTSFISGWETYPHRLKWFRGLYHVWSMKTQIMERDFHLHIMVGALIPYPSDRVWDRTLRKDLGSVRIPLYEKCLERFGD